MCWRVAIIPAFPDGVMTLVGEPTGDRVVYAFAGADGSFSESVGPSYVLTSTGSATGTVAATWNSAPLAACSADPAPPCVVFDTGVARAFVSGSGTLELANVAKLDVMNANANEQLIVRY